MLWKASEYSSALRTLPSRQVGHRPAHNTYLPRLTRHRRPLDLFINRAGLEREKDIAPASYLTNLLPGKRRSNAEF